MLLRMQHSRAQPRNNAEASTAALAKPTERIGSRSSQRMAARSNEMDKASKAQAQRWSLRGNILWPSERQSDRQDSGSEWFVWTKGKSRRLRRPAAEKFLFSAANC